MVFAYYDCPMLCTMVINGLASALDVLSLVPGKDFEIVTVSFDPHDTPSTAAAKKAPYIARYKQPGAAAAWHFFTGDQPSIHRLTRAAGFRYVWDKETKQFAHPTGVIVLTSEGRLARYLFGIEYGPQRFALRHRRGIERQRRLGSRLAAALLLSLRPDDGQVRRGDHSGHSIGGRRHRARPCDIHRDHGAPRERNTPRAFSREPGPRTRASRSSTGSPATEMWSGTPLFPESASTMPGRVDTLYFFYSLAGSTPTSSPHVRSRSVAGAPSWSNT